MFLVEEEYEKNLYSTSFLGGRENISRKIKFSSHGLLMWFSTVIPIFFSFYVNRIIKCLREDSVCRRG